MASATLTIDYGSYKSFQYKRKNTDFQLSWDAPEGLEAKYVKEFDDFVTAGLKKLESTLSSGVAKAKEWLKAADDRITAASKLIAQKKPPDNKDLVFYVDHKELLPAYIENFEKQREHVLKSMLDKIYDGAVDHVIKKFKIEKYKKRAKKIGLIVVYAVLVVLAAVAAGFAIAATWGVAAGPIIALIGAGVATAGGLGGLVARSKSIWENDKSCAKGMQAAADAFADATAKFHEALERQRSQLAAKRAQLALLHKQVQDAVKHVDGLDRMKDKAPKDLSDKIAAAVKTRNALMKSYEEVKASIERQAELLGKAEKNLDPKEARAYAATLKDSWGKLEILSDLSGQIGGIFNSFGGAL